MVFDGEVFLGERVGREAGGVHDFDGRPQLSNTVRQLDAVVLAGHDDVGNHDVDVGDFGDEMQGVGGVAGDEGLVAELVEVSAADVEYVELVVDEEDFAACARGFWIVGASRSAVAVASANGR